MNILHIAPHLGGGVGKAHATLASARGALAGPAGRERHGYVLLEPPRDTAYADEIRRAGGTLHVAPDAAALAALVAAADVVQVEWWNHPRLYQVLATAALPLMRLIVWVHISSLAPPLVPGPLLELADKTLFTSACSLAADNLRTAVQARPSAFGVANSGFVFPATSRPPRPADGHVRMGYLGTLDFAKMHPGFFDLVDAMDTDLPLSLWGRLDPQGEVAARAAAMRRPRRIRFEGFADDPAGALAALDVFVYLLAPGHYGTGENALIEAMSLGAVPIVWGNPAETAIVEDGVTGFVVRSLDEFVACASRLVRDGAMRRRLGDAARAAVALERTPEATLGAFADAYGEVMRAPKRERVFAAALGRTPQDWFLSSLGDPGTAPAGDRLFSSWPTKGSLGHFRDCLRDDPGLAALAQA